ncbi:MAG: hypothetical protein DCC75_03580 [Proteobacteria bacterium]|nr:MAG: hypothetical protein DCC75_03580 [Pseudomonadota bacterium]
MHQEFTDFDQDTVVPPVPQVTALTFLMRDQLSHLCSFLSSERIGSLPLELLDLLNLPDDVDQEELRAHLTGALEELSRRHIVSETLPNFRDLGGIIVPGERTLLAGKIFRSGAPMGKDLQRGIEELKIMNVARVIDLRSEDEIGTYGEDLTRNGIEYCNVPLLSAAELNALQVPDQEGFLNGYYYALTNSRAKFAEAFMQMAKPVSAGATLVSCALGKDRTGLLVAVALAALGVAPLHIARDYGFSAAVLAPKFSDEREKRGMKFGQSQEFELRMSSKPKLLLIVLEWLEREYGGAVQYLADGGVTDCAIRNFRSHLIGAPD